MTQTGATSVDSRPLEGKRIVLGVTGGIAAYKAVEVCRRLTDLGAHVVPVLTEAATKMIGLKTFEALASEAPKTSIFDDVDPIPHTRLGQSADLILVCPATARIISDCRTGRSADLLSATLIASEAPLVLCPAMHSEMWAHPAVQDNITVLRERGVHIVGPTEGRLAGGDSGNGRLADPEHVVAGVIDALTNQDLAGRHVVVTAGGTRESLDPVRFIGNRSTGKQGYAFAEVARSRGAKVTLIATVQRDCHPGIEFVSVETAAEMHDAVHAVAAVADIIVMTAAVADFRPTTVATTKIKKSGGVPTIDLERTVDILASLGASKPDGQVLVGFAAETNDLLANAERKLEAKNADFIVANDVSAAGVGFAHDTNQVTILGRNGVRIDLPLGSKSSVASSVLDVVSGNR